MADNIDINVTPIIREVTIEVTQAIKGDDGVGVVAGGTAGQVLAKIDATDFNTEWKDDSGGKFVDGTDTLDAVYMDGNVGIGTETPSHKLHVEGSLRFNYNAGGSGVLGYSNAGNLIMSLTRQNTPVNASVGLSSFGDIGFASNVKGGVPETTNYDLIIKESGNVGIGTTTPSEKLEVNGNAKADSFLIDGGKAIKTDVVGEPTGSDQVVNVVSLSQAEYDAGTPIATTFYIIT